MALKALISRKWKLDNCSEEREREGPFERATMWESCFEKRAEIKPSVKCNSRFGEPALKDRHETTKKVATDFLIPTLSSILLTSIFYPGIRVG